MINNSTFTLGIRCIVVLMLGFTLLFGNSAMASSIYDFNLKIINSNQNIDFSKFRGRVVMIVNTASKCGFTKQYADLESLYKQYKNQGLIIVATPSNDFRYQEFDDAAQIKNFISTKYNVSFYISEKISVIGDNAHPLYIWLKKQTGRDPLWNFQKYIIDKDGKMVGYFYPSTNPCSKKIQRLLDQYLSQP